MKLKDAEAEVKTLKLPDWVKGILVEPNFDQDNEMYVRVWLKVADDFEYDDYGYEKVSAVEERIRRHLRDKGVEEWVQIGFLPDEEE